MLKTMTNPLVALFAASKPPVTPQDKSVVNDNLRRDLDQNMQWAETNYARGHTAAGEIRLFLAYQKALRFDSAYPDDKNAVDNVFRSFFSRHVLKNIHQLDQDNYQLGRLTEILVRRPEWAAELLEKFSENPERKDPRWGMRLVGSLHHMRRESEHPLVYHEKILSAVQKTYNVEGLIEEIQEMLKFPAGLTEGDIQSCRQFLSASSISSTSASSASKSDNA